MFDVGIETTRVEGTNVGTLDDSTMATDGDPDTKITDDERNEVT
jgi:hypothetical protein